jgi:hypothetical protein
MATEMIAGKLTHHSRESGPVRWEKSGGDVRVSWVCDQEESRNVEIFVCLPRLL